MEKIKVDRGRMVWELLTRPSLVHAAEVWFTGGHIARRKLISSDESGKKSVRH